MLSFQLPVRPDEVHSSGWKLVFNQNQCTVPEIITILQRYLLLDSLLFRLHTTPGKESATLALPKSYVDRIITLYHSSIFGGHQFIFKMYLTINEMFFIPDLICYSKAYLKGCQICQPCSNEKPQHWHLQHGINPNYKARTRLSMDLKVIPKSYKEHRFILVDIDQVTNFMVIIPIHQSRSDK